MIVNETYHEFKRSGEICRVGIYSLSRVYYAVDEKKAPADRQDTVDLAVPAPRKRVMQAVITADCNLNCTYCSFNANAPLLPARRMSPGEIELLTERFNREMGPDGLLLITGGEPELYPEAVDYLVQHIHGKIILFTNGTVTSRERLRFYRHHDVGVLFSLDGDLFAQNAVRRGEDGSYNRVAAALKMAGDEGLPFGISAVVGDHNIDRLTPLVESIMGDFHPASLGLNLPHRYGDTAWLRIEEYTDALLEVFTLAKRYGLFVDQINRRLKPLAEQRFRFRDCASQGEKIVVFPSGATTSCVNEAGLRERTVDWAERLPVLADECRACYAIGICGGGCIFDGEAIYGPGQFDQRNCYFTRTIMEHLLWDFRDELGDDAADREAVLRHYQALLNRPAGTYLSVGHETV